MTREPLEVIHEAIQRKLVNEDGESVVLSLLPPLSKQELDDFRVRLPMPLPLHIEHLLQFCRGIDGTSAAETLDFTGSIDSEFADAFPHGFPIATDGYGNFWLADLQPSSTDLGPIYYACHDPPIALFQSASLADFLEELLKLDIPPHKSLLDDVHEDRLYRVWRDQPGLISQPDAAASTDPVLREFAARLTSSHVLVDLRGAKPGQGFAWGRYGMNAVLRHGFEPVFALAKKKSFFARLLAR